MARIKAEGLDEMVRKVRASGQNADKTLKKAIDAGGDIIVREITNQIDAKDVWDSGALWWSVKKGPAKKSGDGYELEAWPQGTRFDDKHPHGERNETIGFVNEYGRKNGTGFHGISTNYAGRPFMADAAEVAEEKVADTMLDIMEGDLFG